MRNRKVQRTWKELRAASREWGARIHQGEVTFRTEDKEGEEEAGVFEAQDAEANPGPLRRKTYRNVEQQQRPAGAPLEAVGDVREEHPREHGEVLWYVLSRQFGCIARERRTRIRNTRAAPASPVNVDMAELDFWIY
jgi:hypothetical protein